MKFLKCLFAGHDYQFRNNVHGDRALALGARSIWACAHCGKVDYRKEFFTGIAAKNAAAIAGKEKA